MRMLGRLAVVLAVAAVWAALAWLFYADELFFTYDGWLIPVNLVLSGVLAAAGVYIAVLAVGYVALGAMVAVIGVLRVADWVLHGGDQ